MFLAIDADVNAHLRGALHLSDLTGEAHELGDVKEEIIAYLKGNREDLGDLTMVGTTPPSLKSNFIKVSATDPLIKRYAQNSGNISLLTLAPTKRVMWAALATTSINRFTVVLPPSP
jgi:hypothetical protein